MVMRGKFESDVLKNFIEFLFILECLILTVFVITDCSKWNLVYSPLNIRCDGFH